MAPDPARPDEPASRADSLFVKYLCEASGAAAPDFEAFCAQHPELAAELRQRREDYERLLPILRLAGMDASDPKRFVDELRSRYGSDVDPGVSLSGNAPASESGPSSELLERLRAHAPANSRYKLLGEIGRGGMGAVLKIWDEDLRRTLAMKVVLGKEDPTAKGGTPPVDSRTLGRFLEEAQVTGQLDHPGIVPVHELGLASDRRVYFTMRLVKGEDLRTIYEHVGTGHDGWNETRALGVLLKVCEAMSYAHDKGVVHRDLKPANVMVGKYGEAYVMDWGLARVLGQQDRHDVRLRPEAPTSVSVRTERRSERDDAPDSPVVTMDGDVVGTPAYMPPEQARGEVEQLGPHSDVYALGAMLYHLLARQMPFVPRNVRVSAHAVLMRVLDGPPKALVELAPRAPAELIAICEKAMEREPASRYRDMQALAEDLRAYLERRVVRAYETGTWAETKKWVQRNKPLAASLSAAILIAITGIVWVSAKNVDLAAARLLADEKTRVATRLKDEAMEQSHELKVRGLIQDLAAFEALDDTLEYARSQKRPASEWWLERAHQLVDGVQEDPVKGTHWSPGLADAEARLTNLRERALPLSAEEQARDQAPNSMVWRFAESDDQWWHAQLSGIVRDLGRLKDQIAIAERSVLAPEAAASWKAAIETIRVSDKYHGVKWPNGNRLTPQLGLIPIGPDPASGLWEFSHLESGKVASRAVDRTIVLEPETGLVFVLLPGGRVPAEEVREGMRARQDADLTNIDLDAFFVSKYEMTNEQWDRLGGWPRVGERAVDPLLPVSGISWDDCAATLSLAGAWLWLPAEAQWEYACRAGTTTPWWTGTDEASLRGAANLSVGPTFPEDISLQPVGTLRANPFGLHDVHGNVGEWCRDALGPAGLARRPADGLLDEPDASVRVLRGGLQWVDAEIARSSDRLGRAPGLRIVCYGLRPVRGITP